MELSYNGDPQPNRRCLPHINYFSALLCGDFKLHYWSATIADGKWMCHVLIVIEKTCGCLPTSQLFKITRWERMRSSSKGNKINHMLSTIISFLLQNQGVVWCIPIQFLDLLPWDGYWVPCEKDKSFLFACHWKNLVHWMAPRGSPPVTAEYRVCTNP